MRLASLHRPSICASFKGFSSKCISCQICQSLAWNGCVPRDCGGKEPYFRAIERDPTPSRVTRATIHKELACDSKEGARIRSYIGIVTDIPMPGQLVELNKRAWLLLTHYNVSQLQGLRVGAMVAVRPVHIMVLDSAGEKGLLLGACFRSHVCVVLFSDLNVMPVLQQPSRNHLSKHMEHLPFASAFWVLQVIVSLRCKFQGVYTQKQVIGSKKCACIIQACLPILLTTPVTLHQDVFKEFFWHNRFCHLGDDLPSRLSTKVPPISNFCDHIESLWHDQHSIVWQAGKKHCDCFDTHCEWNPSLGLQTGENSAHYVRRIIPVQSLALW
ncbi:unnamed protein product [Sphagnum jensenii]|uniref:CST complex subunit CTC1 n=1 Tax=Sphagnum jensenii TaxID=128206 RepID=A0ABP0VY18_9BRYO